MCALPPHSHHFQGQIKVLVCGGSSCRLLDLRLDQSDLRRAGVCTGGPERSPVRARGMNKLQNSIKGAFSIYFFQSRVPCLLVMVLSSMDRVAFGITWETNDFAIFLLFSRPEVSRYVHADWDLGGSGGGL